MPRYWIAVACRAHVLRGAAGGFCQVCHGKPGPLARMAPGDWMVCYSPTERLGDKAPLQAFTAIGQIRPGDPYQFDMGGGFVPHRRDVAFRDCREVPIRPLLDSLDFVTDKKHWGAKFRFGLVEVGPADFAVIAAAMLGEVPT